MLNLNEYPDHIRIPSNNEIAELHQLVPRGKPIDADMKTVINAIFSMCSEEWISNFLFNREMSHSAILSSPWNLKHAVTCSFGFTSVQPDPQIPNFASNRNSNPFDTHLNGDYVFVPSMSINNYTAGVGIERILVHCNAHQHLLIDDNLINGHNHFRYVCNDEDRTMLSVHDAKKAGIIKISYSKNIGTTRKIRYFVMARRELFFSAFQSSVYPQLDVISKSIHIVQNASEFRQCPFCGAQPNRNWSLNDPLDCDCQFQLETPKHPCDLEVANNNMWQHTGVFEGPANASFCVDGYPIMSATLGSRIIIQGGCDDDLIEKFSKWGISDELSRSSNPLFKSILAPQDYENRNSFTGSSTTDHSLPSCSNESSNENNDEARLTNIDINMNDERFNYNIETENLQNISLSELPDIDGVLGMDLGGEFGERMDFTTPALVQAIESNQSESSQTYLNSGTRTSIEQNGVDMSLQQAQPLTNNSIETQPQQAVNQSPIENGHLGCYETGSNIEEMAMNIISNDNRMGGISMRRENGPIRIAPAQMSSSENASKIEKEIDAAAIIAAREAERANRAERRKQRNREAAQRSNQRRKEGLQQLKNDLEQAHSKVTALREREQALREENVRLRKRQTGQA